MRLGMMLGVLFVASAVFFCTTDSPVAPADDNPTDSSGIVDTADTSGDTSTVIDTSDTTADTTNVTDTTDTMATATLSGLVRSAADSTNMTVIPFASVVVYDANTNQPVTRTVADSLGRYTIDLPPGVYYLRIEAAAFKPSPSPYGAPIPFEVKEGQTSHVIIELPPDSAALDYGAVEGYVTEAGTGVNGVLLIAVRLNDSLSLTAISGPDGYYAFYNIPPGDYWIKAYKAHYECVDSALVAVALGDTAEAGVVGISAYSGTRLYGRLTFRATTNDTVDVTLVDPLSLIAVPGLTAWCRMNVGTYELRDIPPGSYITWASYRNDGNVVDPDYVFRVGLPILTFTDTDTVHEASFSLTDAIPLVRPTNPPESVYPVAISTTRPEFVWKSYPSTKEYVVAVYNTRGDRIWGGHTKDGTILHPRIEAKDTSCVFDFDGSAVAPIEPGEIYRWKVSADFSADPGVQKFISASEDLMGLFYFPSVAD